MNINREDVIVSALSSLLLENIVECEDFNNVEKFGVEKTSELLCRAFKCALEAMDEVIFQEKDLRFKSKGFEVRSVLTSAGLITYKRRRYKSESEAVYLLDEALGLPHHLKVSPQLSCLAATFALDASYQAAADALSYYIGTTLSRSSVKRLLKQNACLLEGGNTQESKVSSPSLNIEADGCYVYQQRTKAQKRADKLGGKKRSRRASKEVAIFCAYSGKKNVGKNVKVRTHATHFATTKAAPDAWSEFSSLLSKRYDTDNVTHTNFATDGDAKYLKGAKTLPGKVSVGYDLHHIPSKIAHTLGADIAREVFATMKELGFEDGFDILETYCEHFYELEKDEKYLDLIEFFNTHKQSMKTALVHNLGTMEGSIAHIIGSRCKRFGGGWGTGLDPMVRLRAARASGIRPVLATRKSTTLLPEIVQSRTLLEVENFIADLEQRAKENYTAYDRKKLGDKPLYYHQVQVPHKSSNERCASLLRKWG